MTALSQGRMGYYTNPRMQMQSKRTSSSSSSSSLLKNNAMKTLDRKQTLTRLQKRSSSKGSTTTTTTNNNNNNSSKASSKAAKKSAKAAFFLPTNLSTASSSGNIQSAISILQQTSRELQAQTKISLSYFAWMCRLIFLPDATATTSSSSTRTTKSSSSSNVSNNSKKQNHYHSALYYAAINGHVTLVELYLSLYLLGSIKVNKETVMKECTFQEWFDLYGTKSFCLSHLFGTHEYDQYVHHCGANGMGHVKQIMGLKKVSISSVLDFISNILKTIDDGGAAAAASIVERQSKDVELQVNRYMSFVANSKKNRRSKSHNNKPKLVCEDLYDTADYQHDDDYLSDEEEEEEHVDNGTDGEYSNDEEEWSEEDENVPPEANSSSTLEHHEQQLAELEELVKNDEFSIAFHDDDVSFHSNSNSTNVVDTVPPPLTVVSKDEEDDDSVISGELQDGWDLVSDVGSVKSIDSTFMKPSYKDILMQPNYIDLELVIVEDPNQVLIQNLGEETSTKEKASSSTPTSSSSSSTSSSNDKDDRMDEETPILTIEDEREGVKTQRGGKPSKMFKGEGKARPTGEKSMQRVRSRNCKPSNMFGLTDTRSNSYAPQYY